VTLESECIIDFMRGLLSRLGLFGAPTEFCIAVVKSSDRETVFRLLNQAAVPQL